MTKVPQVGRIQVEEDLNFLRKDWRFQRIGWVAMVLLAFLGLAGALGRGPLAKTEAGDRDILAVTYDRVIRHSSNTRITIFAGPHDQGDTLRVFISSRYLAGFELNDIVPAPVSSGVRAGYVYYEFLRNDPTGRSVITMHLSPQDYWSADAQIFAEGTPPLHVRQLILP